MVPEHLAAELEPYVDEHGLGRVLEALVAVCLLKAEHIAMELQDERQAREWERAAGRVSRTICQVGV